MKNIGVMKINGKNYLLQKHGRQIYINCMPIENYKKDIRDQVVCFIKSLNQER